MLVIATGETNGTVAQIDSINADATRGGQTGVTSGPGTTVLLNQASGIVQGPRFIGATLVYRELVLSSTQFSVHSCNMDTLSRPLHRRSTEDHALCNDFIRKPFLTM